MNALTTIAPAALPTAANPAPTLTLLALHSSLSVAVPRDLIARGDLTPDNLPGLRSYLSEAQRLLVGASRREVVTLVGSLSQHYPQPDLSAEANAQRWADWAADFADTPPDILAAACASWRRSSNRFAPSPGQLLELCVAASYRALLAKRAEAAINMLEAA